MNDHASLFLLVTVLVLATILAIFGMKYLAAARAGPSRWCFGRPAARTSLCVGGAGYPEGAPHQLGHRAR